MNEELKFSVVHLWVNRATGKVLGRLRAPPVQILLLRCSFVGKQFLFFTPVRSAGVTFVKRHKSNQKDFFGTAQEGIKMTALRGKSRISLPLRLHIS